MTDNRKAFLVHAFADTPDALIAALRAARHASEDLRGEAQVQVVVQGGAVHGLTSGSPHEDDVRTTITGSGVEVVACENRMRRIGVTLDKLLPEVGTVPAAAAHLTRRQWDGAAYVRV